MLLAGALAGDLTPLGVWLRDTAVAEDNKIREDMLTRVVEKLQLFINPDLWLKLHDDELRERAAQENTMVVDEVVDVNDPAVLDAWLEESWRRNMSRGGDS